MNFRSGNQCKSTAIICRAWVAGVLRSLRLSRAWRRALSLLQGLAFLPAGAFFFAGLAFLAGGRLSATSTGNAQGRRHKGNLTLIAITTHLCPRFRWVVLREERIGSRYVPTPKTLRPECPAIVSSTSTTTGWSLGTNATTALANILASGQSDHREAENKRL